MATAPLSNRRLTTPLTIAIAVVLSFFLAQCATSDSGDSDAALDSATDAEAESAGTAGDASSSSVAPSTTAAVATTSSEAETEAEQIVDLPVDAGWSPTEDDFGNLYDMTAVRGFFVDNLLGYDEETLAVAESPTGGVWPVGSLVQLFPGEAMVKRQPGFNPVSGDWEFFELDVSETGSTIRVRGGDNVVNRFGGQCSLCHSAASNQWDHICEQDHGCEPLPIERTVIETLQENDPRPRAQIFES